LKNPYKTGYKADNGSVEDQEEVWVNAPRPLQSPIAQMPGTLARS
jgi:hypothetical protein